MGDRVDVLWRIVALIWGALAGYVGAILSVVAMVWAAISLIWQLLTGDPLDGGIVPSWIKGYFQWVLDLLIYGITGDGELTWLPSSG